MIPELPFVPLNAGPVQAPPRPDAMLSPQAAAIRREA